MKSVIICDMEGVIQEMNKGALDMFGYSKDELVGIKRVSIFSEADIVIQNVLGWLDEANKKGKSTVKTRFKRKDGSLFNAESILFYSKLHHHFGVEKHTSHLSIDLN